MKFKITKIAAAVAAGLGVSAVGTGVVQADSLLFPYFATGDAVTTLISTMNQTPLGVAAANRLHYRYVYRQVDVNTGAGSQCTEFNYFVPSSTNDILTVDIGARYGNDQGVMFEPGQPAAGNPRYPGQVAPFPLENDKPAIGFLVVDNNTDYPGRNVLSGEAFIVDFTTGSVWGYNAYNAADIWASNGTQINPHDFSDRVETAGEVLVARPAGANPSNYWAPIAIMPFEQVTTRLYVTPIGLWSGGTNDSSFQLTGYGSAEGHNLTARVGLTAGANGQFAIYDRDEQSYSGTVQTPVTCVGRVTLNTLIPQSLRNATRNGGWSNVAIGAGGNGAMNANGTVANRRITDQAVVIKLEFNPDANTNLEGEPVNGSFNNGIWLRKGIRESLAGAAVDTRPVAVSPTSTSLPIFAIPSVGENNSPFPVLNAASLGTTILETDLQRPVLGNTSTTLSASALATNGQGGIAGTYQAIDDGSREVVSTVPSTQFTNSVNSNPKESAF
jgi:hypothetical protein